MKPYPQHLQKVRVLTLRGLATYWAPELQLTEEDLLHELRLGILNIPIFLDGGDENDFVDPEMDDDQLENIHRRVNKEWVRHFCRKQHWPMPSFWSDSPHERKSPGRPSNKDEVLEVFKKRLEKGQTRWDSLIIEAGEIRKELHDSGLSGKIPNEKTISGHIRERYNQLKDNNK